MNLKTTIGTMRRAVLAATVVGAMMWGGGCSLRSIGAGLLSEFLTSGGTMDSMLGSALSSALGELLEPPASSSTEEPTEEAADESAGETEA